MGVMRRERENRGLTIREISQEIDVPVDMLAAIEADEGGPLIPGGRLAHYRDRYLRYLGLEQDDLDGLSVSDDTDVTATAPLPTDPALAERAPTARILAAGAMLVLVVLLGLWVVALAVDGGGEPSSQAASLQEQPDQELTIRAVEPTRIDVTADGEAVFHGILAPRNVLHFSACDRLSVYVSTLGQVKIVYNGQALRPLGKLDYGRRLVFVDDSDS